MKNPWAAVLSLALALIFTSLAIRARTDVEQRNKQRPSERFMAPCAADELEYDLRQEVGRALARRRRATGCHAQSVADALGISQGTYSKVERGEAGPTMDMVVRVALKLGVKLGVSDE